MEGLYVFLDDERNPPYCTAAIEIQPFPWTICRDYKEFQRVIVKFVDEHGKLPNLISFDHDLAPEHYRSSMYDPDRHYNNYYTDGTFTIPTGYHAAEWLIEFCKERNLRMCSFQVHSLNPLGRENIQRLLGKFRRGQRTVEINEAKSVHE